MTRLSIVLPCYNEGPTLRRLIEGYDIALAAEPDVEVILVNNGSSDETDRRIAEELQRNHPFRLATATVHVNRGYGYGILTGLALAQGEFVAWSHADLQTPAGDVVRLLHKVLSRPHPEQCFGKGHRISERGGAAVFTHLHTLLARLILGCRLIEINAQPKLFHRSFLKHFRRPPLGYELDTYAYYKAVRRQLEIVTVDVEFLQRSEGRSKWAYSLMSRLGFMAGNLLYLLFLRLSLKRI